jgi:GT2 family glycosyltransferase
MAAASADIASALALAPRDIGANRRMLAWGEGVQRREAALALIACDTNPDVLARAIEIVRSDGQRAIANVRILDDAVEGWAVWEEQVSLEVAIADDANGVAALFEPAPQHRFRTFGRATDFRLPRPRSPKPQLVVLSIAGQVFYTALTASNEATQVAAARELKAPGASDYQVTVIVPVYADYEATRACVESLLEALKAAPHHRTLLVNDATPDVRVAQYLADIAKLPSVVVLTNATNLGFVGSVNRTLAEIAHGDVVLLNADTVVPRGFLDRLAEAAQSSPDIGTVMPLSNNGDLAGFPIPNEVNLLGSIEEIERIDKTAAKVNSGRLVDIPNGVGFCLYITRACLDAVGFLSEDFDRGYLEDVDFCLRARERGFRNVCAPSVYIGHAGGKSFGGRKRALVVRNLEVLETRFPKYRFEYAAFSRADPLKSYRQAIERVITRPATPPRLLVTGAGVVGAVAAERARILASEGRAALILEVRHGAGGSRVSIRDPMGGAPQSIEFDLSSSREWEELFAYARTLRPSRIEFFDPTKVPFPLVDLLFALRIPYDMVIANAGLLGRNCADRLLEATRSIQNDGFVGLQNPITEKISVELQEQKWIRRWCEIAEGAEKILVPCEQARGFATGLFARRKLSRIARTDHTRKRRQREKGAGCHLGLLPVKLGAQEHWLTSQIAHGFRLKQPSVSMTVIGTTLDDLSLMQIGNVHVTGSVEPGEFQHLVEAYNIQYLFANVTQPLFGHPLLSAASSSAVPTAYFDWSTGRAKVRRRDLTLDPRLSLDAILAALGEWVTGS